MTRAPRRGPRRGSVGRRKPLAAPRSPAARRGCCGSTPDRADWEGGEVGRGSPLFPVFSSLFGARRGGGFPRTPRWPGARLCWCPRARAVRASGGLQTRRRRRCSPRIGIRLDHRSGGAPRGARCAARDARVGPPASRAEQADDKTGGGGQFDWVLDWRRHGLDRRTPLIARLSDRHCGEVVPLLGHGRGSLLDLGGHTQSMIVTIPPRRK